MRIFLSVAIELVKIVSFIYQVLVQNSHLGVGNNRYKQKTLLPSLFLSFCPPKSTLSTAQISESAAADYKQNKDSSLTPALGKYIFPPGV
jgi:hypothetical protein